MRAHFSNLRHLLFSKTQYSLDLTSKIRIERNIFELPFLLSKMQLVLYMTLNIAERRNFYFPPCNIVAICRLSTLYGIV